MSPTGVVLTICAFASRDIVAKHGFVADDAKRAGLRVHRARRLNGRVDEFGNYVFAYRFGGVFAHRTARVNRFFEVHDCVLMLALDRARPILPGSRTRK
jgi:hypothetical protein